MSGNPPEDRAGQHRAVRVFTGTHVLSSAANKVLNQPTGPNKEPFVDPTAGQHRPLSAAAKAVLNQPTGPSKSKQ